MHNIKYVKSHPVAKNNPNAFIVTVTAIKTPNIIVKKFSV